MIITKQNRLRVLLQAENLVFMLKLIIASLFWNQQNNNWTFGRKLLATLASLRGSRAPSRFLYQNKYIQSALTVYKVKYYIFMLKWE